MLIGTSVEIVATSDEGYTFAGWYIDGSDTPVSAEAEFTFTVSESVTLVAKFEECDKYNGYETIDLGLPSGLLWATFNVGATKPEEHGGYYAWGETEEKDNYGWSTYKYCNGSYDTMTKYCKVSSYGTVDNKTVLEPEDDVAHVKWGGSWRMPTKAELDELLNNCTWEWTTLNGVNGYRITGSNGSCIFLPAAGWRDGTETCYKGDISRYWSSSLRDNDCPNACNLYINERDYDWDNSRRFYCLCVRPVCE